MTAILFLDFDGVLHPEPCHGHPRFGRLPLLEQALERLPHLEVVISSSWRHGRTLSKLQKPFSLQLRPRVVGFTPTFKDFADHVPDAARRFPREAECLRWLHGNAPAGTPWLALDDCPWLFAPLCPQVIEVDGSVGLQERDVSKLLRLAGSMQSPDVSLP